MQTLPGSVPAGGVLPPPQGRDPRAGGGAGAGPLGGREVRVAFVRMLGGEGRGVNMRESER